MRKDNKNQEKKTTKKCEIYNYYNGNDDLKVIGKHYALLQQSAQMGSNTLFALFFLVGLAGGLMFIFRKIMNHYR